LVAVFQSLSVAPFHVMSVSISVTVGSFSGAPGKAVSSVTTLKAPGPFPVNVPNELSDLTTGGEFTVT
jgi:hypothetical protein